MKSAVLSALYLFSVLFTLGADLPPAKYSGKASVDGLGTIALPAGEWILEFRRVQLAGADKTLRDYFTFKRVDADLERITIFRYRPGYPWPIRNMLDGISETMGNGIPPEEEPNKGGQEIHTMRLVPQAPKPEDKHITFSFISMRQPPSRSWLCHSYLFMCDSYAFVLTHSSQVVISPEAVQDVGDGSRLLTTPLQPPNK
jgi:hypothetical protein